VAYKKGKDSNLHLLGLITEALWLPGVRNKNNKIKKSPKSMRNFYNDY
jgi:hypothetical protein